MTVTADDFQILALDFEAALEQTEDAKVVACLKNLIETVNQVQPEILETCFELFEDLTDSEQHLKLLDEVRRGWWFPETATEFVQRFIAKQTQGE
jgi:hypothetical protein